MAKDTEKWQNTPQSGKMHTYTIYTQIHTQNTLHSGKMHRKGENTLQSGKIHHKVAKYTHIHTQNTLQSGKVLRKEAKYTAKWQNTLQREKYTTK